VLTYDTEVNALATVKVNEEIHLVIQIKDLDIKIRGVIDSAVGPISYWRINAALSVILFTLEEWINIFLRNGWDLNTLL